MKVQKGIIAAAGFGTRFLPVVKAYPKELIPVLAKPNLQYLVEEMLGAGIKRIAIVHRHGDPRIKRYFTPDHDLEAFLKKTKKEKLLVSLRKIWSQVKEFRFIPQSPRLPYGNASPVLASRGFLKNDPFVYMFGDDLIVEKNAGDYLSQMIWVFEKYSPAVILGAQKVGPREISRYASLKFIKDEKYPHRIEAVLEKLESTRAPSLFAQLGRFVYRPKIIEVLKNLSPASRGGGQKELWLADANNFLAKNDIAIAEPIKKGQWLTTGDPLRWLKANLIYALNNPELKVEIEKFLKNFSSRTPRLRSRR